LACPRERAVIRRQRSSRDPDDSGLARNRAAREVGARMPATQHEVVRVLGGIRKKTIRFTLDGELAIVVGAAVANAVFDAVGAHVLRMPMTAELVRAAVPKS
jgi:hypothetical protein